MRLQYEISADARQLKTVLRGVEAEAKASNRRIGRDQAATVYGPSRREAAAARRFEESQNRALARAKESLDRQRSQALLANIKAEERERLRADRNVAKAAEQLDRQRASGLMQQFRERQRQEARLAADRQRSTARIASGVATTVGRGFGSVVRAGGAVAGLAGGFAAANALQEQMNVGRLAREVAFSGGAPEQKGQLAKEATQFAGFSGSEVLGGMAAFVKPTGDLGAARGIMKDLAELTLATSGNLEDMGEAAGRAFIVIRDQIKDPKEQIAAVNEVMRTFAGQGQIGAVEIRDMAKELAGLGAASRAFKGGPVELLKVMGAMAQASVARGGATDAAEATTAVTRFAADLTKHPAQKALAGLGVNVFADKGRTQLKGPEEIMSDILEKTGGDLVKIEEVLNAESKKALAGFAPLFLQAEREKKGTGRAAIHQEYLRLTSAGMSAEQAHANAASALEDPDVAIKEATKAFNAAIGDNLVPVARDAAKAIGNLTPLLAEGSRALSKFVGFALEHPLEGAGAIVGASIAKDISEQVAKAGLDAALKSAISGSLVGTGGIVVGTLAASIGLAKLIVDSMDYNAQRAVGSAVGSANDVRARARAELESSGTLSDATRAELQKLSATESGTLKKSDAYLGSNEGYGAIFMRGWRQLFGGDKNLDEAAKLRAVGTSQEYRKGASETKALLEVDQSGKRFGEAAAKRLLELVTALPGNKDPSRTQPINTR